MKMITTVMLFILTASLTAAVISAEASFQAPSLSCSRALNSLAHANTSFVQFARDLLGSRWREEILDSTIVGSASLQISLDRFNNERALVFHGTRVKKNIRRFPKDIQTKLMSALLLIQSGGVLADSLLSIRVWNGWNNWNRTRLWELKLRDHDNNQYRVIYIRQTNVLGVIYAFKKKTQKASKRDVANIQRNAKDFIKIYGAR